MNVNGFLKSLVIVLGMITASSTPAIAAETPEYDFPVSPTDPDKGEGGTSRDRMPARPANCTISIDGVYIDGETVAIESFEVRDPEGNTVAIFSDEKAFISFIFSSEGEFELIFRLPSRILHGFITI